MTLSATIAAMSASELSALTRDQLVEFYADLTVEQWGADERVHALAAARQNRTRRSALVAMATKIDVLVDFDAGDAIRATVTKPSKRAGRAVWNANFC